MNPNEKLALSDDILMKVEKPERYIGHEVNSVIKDKGQIAVRFAMCFPDVYEIGMSHLGIQILYDMFNSWEDVWCERVYSPWIDLDAIMRRENIPLFALESQDPVKEFDFLGITIQYEMCYTNILQILDLAQIPLNAADRGEDCPIVIGGGPCTYNPEPIADFFDLFYIGEGETQYRNLLNLYKECREHLCGAACKTGHVGYYRPMLCLLQRLVKNKYHCRQHGHAAEHAEQHALRHNDAEVTAQCKGHEAKRYKSGYCRYRASDHRCKCLADSGSHGVLF